MLTLALSSWSFHRRLPYFGKGSWSPPHDGPEISILSLPELSVELGITTVEICQAHLASTDLEYLADVGAAVEDAGCRVVNMPIDVGNTRRAVSREEKRGARSNPSLDRRGKCARISGGAGQHWSFGRHE